MRKMLAKCLGERFKQSRFAFITGDLGFNALEPLRDVMGEFFINAGVAEQNMVSVSAGLARIGFETWVYSIAPFCYARPFEQIRNDICLHNLPVNLVGNGGGYAYGAMGASHHALEDYGVLLTLPGMKVYVPAFDDDITQIVEAMSEQKSPSYLRLGRCEKPDCLILGKYTAWRRIVSGSDLVAVVAGPLVGGIARDMFYNKDDLRTELWVVSEMPLALKPPPDEFLEGINRIGRLCVVEEHVAQGGLGQQIASWLMENGVSVRTFKSLCAKGYVSGCYGSQAFHRMECGLDSKGVVKTFKMMIEMD